MKPVSSGFTLMLKLLDVMTRPDEVRTCGWQETLIPLPESREGGRGGRDGGRAGAERRKEAREPYSLHTVWKLSSSDGRAWPAPCPCSLPASASAPPPQPHSPPPVDPPPVHQDAERLLHQTFKNAATSWLLRSLQGEQGRSIQQKPRFRLQDMKCPKPGTCRTAL
ncbi:hypothetical protein ACER0C_028164 [Sarotherodon galilaeus]